MARTLEPPVLRGYIWCWPTPATTIVSSSAKLRSRSTQYCGLSGRRFLAVAQRVLRCQLVQLPEPRRAVGRAGALLSLGQLGRQLGDHVLAVADDRDVDQPVLPDLGRVDVHVDDLGVGRERRQLAGDAVVEARAERDQQVGPLHRGDGRVVAVHAGHAQAELVGVGERAARHQRGDDGQLADRRPARMSSSEALALITPPPT